MTCYTICTSIIPSTLTTLLLVIGTLTTLGGAILAFILSKDTEHEHAWLLLAIGLTFYSIHQILIIPWVFGILPKGVHVYADQGSLLFASILVLLSLIHLTRQLRSIRNVDE